MLLIFLIQKIYFVTLQISQYTIIRCDDDCIFRSIWSPTPSILFCKCSSWWFIQFGARGNMRADIYSICYLIINFLSQVIVMIWSFRVLVTWRKRQNFLAHRWGTMNYKVEETTRPQFHGDWIEHEIAGEREHIIHYPSWKRWLKYCISIPLTAFFTITLLIGMLVVYANR